MTSKEQYQKVYYRRCMVILLKIMKHKLIVYSELRGFMDVSDYLMDKCLRMMVKFGVLRRVSHGGAQVGWLPRIKKHMRIKGYLYFANPDENGMKVKMFILDKMNLFSEDKKEFVKDIVKDYDWGWDARENFDFIDEYVSGLYQDTEFLN